MLRVRREPAIRVFMAVLAGGPVGAEPGVELPACTRDFGAAGPGVASHEMGDEAADRMCGERERRGVRRELVDFREDERLRRAELLDVDGALGRGEPVAARCAIKLTAPPLILPIGRRLHVVVDDRWPLSQQSRARLRPLILGSLLVARLSILRRPPQRVP